MYTPLFGLGLVLPLNIPTEIIVVVNTLKVGYNITMNEGYPPEGYRPEFEPGRFEQFPPEALISYFQNQFRDGYVKQNSELSTDDSIYNGEFVRSEPVEEAHNITRGSHRIILKPPHPTDTAGFYCEVYAIFDKRLAESTNDEIPGANARMFVVRDFNNGRSGPFFLVDEDGAICIDIFEDGIITASDDDIIPDSIAPLERAESMLKKFKHYNIVASTD